MDPFGVPTGLPPDPIRDPVGAGEWATRELQQRAAAVAAGATAANDAGMLAEARDRAARQRAANEDQVVVAGKVAEIQAVLAELMRSRPDRLVPVLRIAWTPKQGFTKPRQWVVELGRVWPIGVQPVNGGDGYIGRAECGLWPDGRTVELYLGVPHDLRSGRGVPPNPSMEIRDDPRTDPDTGISTVRGADFVLDLLRSHAAEVHTPVPSAAERPSKSYSASELLKLHDLQRERSRLLELYGPGRPLASSTSWRARRHRARLKAVDREIDQLGR